MAHVGEAHCTVEMFKMQEALEHLQQKYNTNDPKEALIQSGLFDRNGNGIKFPMRVKTDPEQGGIDFLVVSSYAYADSWDNENTGLPVVIGVKIEAPLWEKVHDILGTPAYPRLPNGDIYQPHVTIGYMHAQAARPTPEAEEESPADIRQQIRRSYQASQGTKTQA